MNKRKSAVSRSLLFEEGSEDAECDLQGPHNRTLQHKLNQSFLSRGSNNKAKNSENSKPASPIGLNKATPPTAAVSDLKPRLQKRVAQ